MVLAFLLIYFGVRSYRDNVAGGRVGFLKALGVGMLIALVASTLYVATWEAIYFGGKSDYIEKYMAPKDFYMGEIKAAVFGFLIASISCRQGFFASGGAKGVGEATTRAVVQSAVAILIANYVITSWMTPV